MATSQTLPDRQKCTTIAQTFFTFSLTAYRQEDLLALPGALFVSPCRAETLRKVVGQPTEQERETVGVGDSGSPPPGPLSVFAARWYSGLTDMPSSISSLPSCRCSTEVMGQKVGWGEQWDPAANSVLQVEGVVLLLINIPWHPDSSPGYPGLQVRKENSPRWGESNC